MKKNYRLRDLLMDKESMELLNSLSDSLSIKNSDLARLLLQQQLKKIKSEGASGYSLAVVGNIENIDVRRSKTKNGNKMRCM